MQGLEHWPTEKLIDYARNPRKNDHAVDRVSAAIKEFGFRVPIIAKSDGLVVDGHLRLKAAKKLGLETVPVLLADDLSPAQIKAFRLSVNKMAELAEWDDEMLAVELTDLKDMGFDLDLTGFSTDEIEALLAPVGTEGLTDEDAVPEVPEAPVTVLGDVWLLGKHRVMCGDSTSIDAVEKLMDGQKADMVFTDPPYGINEKGDRSKRGGLCAGNNLPDFKDDSIQYAIDAYNICEGLGIKRQVWWGANYYCHALPQSNNWFIWDKRVEEKQKDTQSDCEMAWVKSEFSSVRIFRHLWKGMMKDSERGERRVHATQKPVALAEWAFDYFKNVSSVLDLFGGSGSTLIACEKTGRINCSMELDPKYCDVIVQRWQEFTGQTATLESTGEAFIPVKKAA